MAENKKTNLAELPLKATYSVDQALDAAKRKNLQEVLIVGYNDEGNLIKISSRMLKRDALWMIKKSEQYILDDSI